MRADDRRQALTAAGWRRFDRAGLGERWREAGDSGLGVTFDTAWRKHRSGARAEPAEGPPTITGHVRYAYALRQGDRSNGGDHIVVDEALVSGRLRRDAGDALCKPRSRFRDLSPGGDTRTGRASCPTCLARAERYGVEVLPRPDL